MNAGKNYTKAKAHAQANADADGQPRWLHQYNGSWWISKEPLKEDGKPLELSKQTFAGCTAERIDPSPKPRFGIHHEFDHEPTYVVDNTAKDTEDPDEGPLAVVAFAPHLPQQLRQRLATLVVEELQRAEPVLLTDEQLAKMAEEAP